jgi:hypothetical protein
MRSLSHATKFSSVENTNPYTELMTVVDKANMRQAKMLNKVNCFIQIMYMRQVHHVMHKGQLKGFGSLNLPNLSFFEMISSNSWGNPE